MYVEVSNESATQPLQSPSSPYQVVHVVSHNAEAGVGNAVARVDQDAGEAPVTSVLIKGYARR